MPELFAGIILGKLESSFVKLELSSSASHLLQCGAMQRKELMKEHMNERRRREEEIIGKRLNPILILLIQN